MKPSMLFLAAWLGFAAVGHGADPGPEPSGEGVAVARPDDTGEPLVNPGRGWTMHYYSNVPAAYGWHLAAGDTAVTRMSSANASRLCRAGCSLCR